MLLTNCMISNEKMLWWWVKCSLSAAYIDTRLLVAASDDYREFISLVKFVPGQAISQGITAGGAGINGTGMVHGVSHGNGAATWGEAPAPATGGPARRNPNRRHYNLNNFQITKSATKPKEQQEEFTMRTSHLMAMNQTILSEKFCT